MKPSKKNLFPVIQWIILYLGYVLANIIILVWGNLPKSMESLPFASSMHSLYGKFLWLSLLYIALLVCDRAWWKWICGGILFLAPGVVFVICWRRWGENGGRKSGRGKKKTTWNGMKAWPVCRSVCQLGLLILQESCFGKPYYKYGRICERV